MSAELQKVHEAIAALRTEVESKAGNADKIQNLHDTLDKFEEKNQKLVTDLAVREQAEKDLKERIVDMETKLARGLPVEVGQGAQLKAKVSVLAKALAGGLDTLTPEEFKTVIETSEASRQFASNMGVKLLSTQDNSNGGFLITPEISMELTRNLQEISPMRALVKTRRTRSKFFEIPRRETLVTGGWVGEARLATASNSKYELEQIPMRKCVVFTPATHEELTQSPYNVEAELLGDMRERFAALEGEAIITGDGLLQPQGFLNDSRIAVRNTGVANDITADSIILISGDVKTGYNPGYVLNRKTLARIRTLKDGTGAYLWQPAFMDGTPSTLNGFRYVSAIDMPDVAANNVAIAFGDWSEGYMLVDGVDLAVIRDIYTQATEGIVRFVWHKFQGGQVVKPEALKLLKCAV